MRVGFQTGFFGEAAHEKSLSRAGQRIEWRFLPESFSLTITKLACDGTGLKPVSWPIPRSTSRAYPPACGKPAALVQVIHAAIQQHGGNVDIENVARAVEVTHQFRIGQQITQADACRQKPLLKVRITTRFSYSFTHSETEVPSSAIST
jgi:hypothetical protein